MRLHTGVKDSIDPEMFKKRAGPAARAVAADANRAMRSLVPARTGRLRDSAILDGRKITWQTPYAGPIYYGKLMVDPKFNVGGFPIGNGDFFSRPGVKKVSSGRPLRYAIGEANWIRDARSRYGDRWIKIARKVLLHGG